LLHGYIFEVVQYEMILRR